MVARESGKLLKEGKTDERESVCAAGPGKSWETIVWKTAQARTKKLQMRIAKAQEEGRRGKVQALQRLLTHSWMAKVLAVKRVTENRGKRTPGIDCHAYLHSLISVSVPAS